MIEFLGDVAAWFADPEQWSGNNGIPFRVLEHLRISVLSTVIAAALALPPAVWLAHRRRAQFLANALVNTGRAVPSFGVIILAALLFLELGVPIRFWAVVVAMVALALPPLFTNAYTAVRGVDPGAVDAGRGMGLTEAQILRRIELPMGAPTILAGLRIAFVQVVATATLGAIVGPGGGLGRYIIDGFATLRQGGDVDVFAGAILVALLTLVAERAITLGERAVLPVGVRRLVVRTSEVAETAAAS